VEDKVLFIGNLLGFPLIVKLFGVKDLIGIMLLYLIIIINLLWECSFIILLKIKYNDKVVQVNYFVGRKFLLITSFYCSPTKISYG
jgi:hypothetical protein